MRRIPQDSGQQHHIAELLARHLAASNILGRVDVLTMAKRKTGKDLPMALSSRLHFDDAPSDPLKVGFAFDLPNDDAAGYIRNLTPVTRETFDGLTSQYRKLAFTIAGTSDVRLIQRVRDELAEVVQHGGTAADFNQAVGKMTSDAGVEQINAFSLDTAFNTATQKAYSLGRYEQMTDPATMAVLPFWTYMTVGDERVRPEHRALDGFTARAEDSIWDKLYPPNGFNCRCTVISKLPEEVDENASEPGYSRLSLLTVDAASPAGFKGIIEL